MNPEPRPRKEKDFSGVTPEQLDQRWSEQARVTREAFQQLQEDIAAYGGYIGRAHPEAVKTELISRALSIAPELVGRIRNARTSEELAKLAEQVIAAKTRKDLEEIIAEIDRKYGVKEVKAKKDQ